MDANVVLSALIGGKASKVFAEAKGVEFITTANVVAEILEYVPVLARKIRIKPGGYGGCL